MQQTVSRNLNEYRVPTPAAVGMKQLEDSGKYLRPGQSVRFLYVLGKARARAWDLSDPLDPRTINIPRYQQLLWRAVNAVMEPIQEYYANLPGPIPVLFDKQPVLTGLEDWIRK